MPPPGCYVLCYIREKGRQSSRTALLGSRPRCDGWLVSEAGIEPATPCV